MTDILEINGQEFAPGEQGLARISVGNLPSGNSINIFAHVINAPRPGPAVLLLAGMHGDEVNGMEIVRRAINLVGDGNLIAGSIIAIPLLNIYGFINFSRDVPDGKDVNRSFPGNMKGSLASRVARILTKKILPKVDFILDFHSASDDRFNYPHLRFSPKDMLAREIVLHSRFPRALEKSMIPKSLRKIAYGYKKPVIVFEGGEALRFNEYAIAQGILFIRNVLSHYQMIRDNFVMQDQEIFKKMLWVRAPRSGMLVFARKSGVKIREGELLALIVDPYDKKETRVHASIEGFLLCHSNAPIVHLGDGLFNITYDTV